MDRRKFLAGVGASAIGGSALLGSGAFSRIESQRRVKVEVAADPDAYLGLDECPGSPNASYTNIDGSGHLEIDMSPENPTTAGGTGVNSDSFTYFDDLFQICNQGKQTVAIWVETKDAGDIASPPSAYEDDLPRVQFYNGGDEENRVDSADNAFQLKTGECKCLGMRVMTKGLEEGDQLLKDDEIVIHADADVEGTPVADGSVTIAGEREGIDAGSQSLFDTIDISTAFYPEEGPVTASGSVDIGGLGGNSSVFVGLISQGRFHAWLDSEFENEPSSLFGFSETAYAGFNTASEGRAGLGQRLSFGEVVQNYAADGLGDEITDWEVEFGATEMTLTVDGETVNASYQDHFDYLTWAEESGDPAEANTDNFPVETDWSDGAYAFVATFSDEDDGEVAVNVTFQGSG